MQSLGFAESSYKGMHSYLTIFHERELDLNKRDASWSHNHLHSTVAQQRVWEKND